MPLARGRGSTRLGGGVSVWHLRRVCGTSGVCVHGVVPVSGKALAYPDVYSYRWTGRDTGIIRTTNVNLHVTDRIYRAPRRRLTLSLRPRGLQRQRAPHPQRTKERRARVGGVLRLAATCVTVSLTNSRTAYGSLAVTAR